MKNKSTGKKNRLALTKRKRDMMNVSKEDTRREDTFSYENELRHVLASKLARLRLACALHLWQSHKGKSNRPSAPTKKKTPMERIHRGKT